MSTSIHPSKFHIRPRFTLKSNASVDNICSRYKVILMTKNQVLSGKVRHGYISVFPSSDHMHYWSPHLSVTLEQDEENPNQTVIRGLYGPTPAVWTMFVFIYAIIALATVIIFIIGFANMSIGESGRILWALPILIILLLSIYATSYYGQRKAHDQIEIIDDFFMTIFEGINKKKSSSN